MVRLFHLAAHVGGGRALGCSDRGILREGRGKCGKIDTGLGAAVLTVLSVAGRPLTLDEIRQEVGRGHGLPRSRYGIGGVVSGLQRRGRVVVVRGGPGQAQRFTVAEGRPT